MLTPISDPGWVLERTPVAVCERIICLYRSADDPQWWRILQRPGETVFGGAQRMREAALGNAAAEASRAVAEGYRPVFFLPGPTEWAAVYEALRYHRAFAQLYVLGRDDQVMEYLLHNPSREILDAFALGGRIAVPDLAYGKALDHVLATTLTDFLASGEREDGDWLHPHFHIISRLNPYRQLELSLDCREGTAILRQFYSEAPSGGAAAREPCDMGLGFLDEVITFERGECRLGKTRRELVGRILPRLDLSAPQWQLVAKLSQMSQGMGTYLSGVQRRVLFGLEREGGKIRELMDAVVRWLSQPESHPSLDTIRERRGISVLGVGTRRTVLAPAGPFITDIYAVPSGTELTLYWAEHRPLQAPKVVIRVNGQQITPSDIAWSSDLKRVTLHELELQAQEFGWAWHQATAELELLFKDPMGDTNGAPSAEG